MYPSTSLLFNFNVCQYTLKLASTAHLQIKFTSPQIDTVSIFPSSPLYTSALPRFGTFRRQLFSTAILASLPRNDGFFGNAPASSNATEVLKSFGISGPTLCATHVRGAFIRRTFSQSQRRFGSGPASPPSKPWRVRWPDSERVGPLFLILRACDRRRRRFYGRNGKYVLETSYVIQ